MSRGEEEKGVGRRFQSSRRGYGEYGGVDMLRVVQQFPPLWAEAGWATGPQVRTDKILENMMRSKGIGVQPATT